ncbi:hypothetical protein P3T37_004446 [Kitasatospora sp. MAA4]|uniref:hypothetical protein n=1 Tax=Kitasatospora sp. MAA4 TaxID=3035093 RepID=UPI0024732F02|nr:hypothetical protein [Kitasatospora sp. MAA4]MDH6135036.1 hypothetical protein [Kitasatospora sp. MAA4]
MGERPSDEDYGEDDGVFLSGGPVVAGVDYEGAWLEARAAASQLNALLARLGLSGDELVKAQAGWTDGGRGVVFLQGTLSGARKLGAVLDRIMQCGPVDGGAEDVRCGAG